MSKLAVRVFVVLLVVSALVVACTPPEPEIVEVEVTREVQVEVEVTRVVEVEAEVTPLPTEEPAYYQETAVQNIPLAGFLADRHAEISGMAWYGDYLILMPQYPNFYLEEGTEDNGSLFAIAKADLDAYLNGENCAPIEASLIPFSAPEAFEIEGFEGFESIVFDGDNVLIFDYKTDSLQKITAEEKLENYKPQLKFYALLISKLIKDVKQVTCSLIFIEDPKQVPTFTIYPDQLKKFDEELEGIVNSMRNGIFKTNTSHCKSCYFSDSKNECVVKQ